MKTLIRQMSRLLPILLGASLATGVLVAPVSANESGLAAARRATAAFHALGAANAAGYTVEVQDQAGITCIADPNGAGTMGIHYLNPGLAPELSNPTAIAQVDALHPELLVYAPGPNGNLRLVALEYLALQANWDAGNASPPELFGQQFGLVPAGNRYGLPAFYELHVWIWQPNPSGMFYEWNPRISC